MKFGLILLCLSWIACTGVQAAIVPSVPAVDFGTIKEEDGPAFRRLYVRNDGEEPVAILKVNPSCGCTAVDFMKEPIAPGDSAWVELVYNPEFRPGAFEKYVRIYPTEGAMIKVPVRGTVDAAPSTIETLYPAYGGKLHLSETTFVSTGSFSDGERTIYIDAYNSEDFPVWIDVEIDKESEALRWCASLNPVPPKNKAIILLTIDPYMERKHPVTEYKATLFTSESEENSKASEPVELKILNHGTP